MRFVFLGDSLLLRLFWKRNRRIVTYNRELMKVLYEDIRKQLFRRSLKTPS
jgi:hypothetical protein